MLESKSKELSWKQTCKIYSDRIIKEKIDEELVKSLNGGELPVFEYNS